MGFSSRIISRAAALAEAFDTGAALKVASMPRRPLGVD